MPPPTKKKVTKPPKPSKPSALELLARLSGKKKMEPTVQDAIEEIEVGCGGGESG